MSNRTLLAIMLVAFVLVAGVGAATSYLRDPPDAATAALTKVSVASAVTAGATGLLLVTALVAGHLLLPQATFVVQSADEVKPVAVPRSEEAPTPAAVTAGPVRLAPASRPS